MGGTNCHVILAEAPEPFGVRASGPAGAVAPQQTPWILSAKSAEALHAQAMRLLEHLQDAPDLSAGDVAHTLAVSRSLFDHRAVVLGSDRDQLLAGLGDIVRREPAANVVEGVADAGSRGAVFLFPGQGSQWHGMAREMIATAPAFAQHMHECADALAPHLDWSLMDVVRGEPGAEDLDRIDVVQPALFAVMVSLARLWKSRGVQPGAVVGHSQGEIAAAHLAGALSLEEAARLAALRSRLLTSLVGRGAIVSVALTVQELRPYLEQSGERLSISAVNGPSAVAVAGDHETLDALGP